MYKRTDKPVMLFAVTAARSLKLMRGYPQALANSGWEVHVVSSHGPALESFEAHPHCHVHSLKMRREPSPLQDLMSLMAWVRLLNYVKPDVVSSGTPKAGLIGLLASRLRKVPRRIYHLRGLRLEGETGIKYKLLWTLEKLTCFCATDVLAVSASLKTAAIDSGIVEPEKIRVLGAGSSNGVDLDHFSLHKHTETRERHLMRETGLVSDIPVIGFVGRLTADKGLRELMLAHRLLKQRNVRHQILVVGAIDEKSHIATGGDVINEFLESTLQTGFVPDVEPYYQLMDVLTLPTRREGLPNVAIEAQASGVPVITTDVTGARDAIVDDSTGILIPFGDDQKLADAVEEIISDPHKRDSMAREARVFVAEFFDRKKVWQDLNDYYANGNSPGSTVRTSEQQV